MKKRLMIIGGIILMLGVLIGGILYWQKAQWLPQHIDEVGLNFMVHKSFTDSQLSEDDTMNKILYRINQEGDKPFLITLRSEDGLRLAASLSHQDLIPMLLGNIDKAYPARFSNYQALSTRQFEQNGHKAAEVIFTYDGPAGVKIKQRFLIVDIDGNRALYLAAQAKEADFATLNKKYFDRMFASLTFN